MKHFFILLNICLLSSFSLFSQTFPSVFGSGIWYDSEQSSDIQTLNNKLNNKNTQNLSNSEDSTIRLNYHVMRRFEEHTASINTDFDISQSSRLSVIVVFHSPDTNAEHGIWSVMRDGHQLTGLTDRNLLRSNSSYPYPVKRRGAPMINTSMQSFSKFRGQSDNNAFVLGEATLSDSTTSSFSGDIAECLVFNRFLPPLEALQIESYLAIKYGITLLNSDYVSSSEVVLWNYEENSHYSNCMAGIGKDSIFGLNQKQGSSSEEDNLLTISVGNLSVLNKNNNFTLPEGNYLLWGHNDNELTYSGLSCNEEYPLLERKWLMQTTYSTNNRFSTRVRFLLPEQYRDTSRLCYLVIDRSGTGDFASPNVEYIAQSQIDTDGYVYFDNVIWDLDGSGKDVFTFSLGASLEVVSTNSCPQVSDGSISIDICGGNAPFMYVLTNNTEQFTYQGGRNYTFENLASGEYFLTLVDSNNNMISKTISVLSYPTLISSLPLQYAIQEGSNNFNAEDYFGGLASSYVWEKDSVFFSNESIIDMSLSGYYKLIITDTNGCISSFSTLAEKNLVSKNQKNSLKGDNSEFSEVMSAIPQYKVYPNPTSGKYTVESDFPKDTPITVRVIGFNGSVLSSWTDSGKSHYVFDSYLSTTGNYVIEIESSFGREYLKIVVVK